MSGKNLPSLLTFFTTYILGVFPVFLLNDVLQVVANVCSNVHGFLKTGHTHREDPEPLPEGFVANMKTTVDHTESQKGAGQL